LPIASAGGVSTAVTPFNTTPIATITNQNAQPQVLAPGAGTLGNTGTLSAPGLSTTPPAAGTAPGLSVSPGNLGTSVSSSYIPPSAGGTASTGGTSSGTR
jgi:hypothetical protein